MIKIREKELVKTYYGHSDEERIKLISKIEKKIKCSENPLLLQMIQIVESQVKHYKADFFIHDIAALIDYQEDFIWIIRDSGTHFIPLNDPTLLKDGKWLWKEHYKAIENCERILSYYHYNVKNEKMKKINSKKSEEIIKEYTDLYEK